ncbi:heterokaryon incompatibility, partial [Patellaria atrata CBS 101060]
VRYCALSYVWGGIQGLQLTSKNIHSLMERGGLFSQPQPIPVVIQDAITLVAALRLRYLWVDQLSIPQDDPKGKLHEISQMDSIYSQAFLTI